jgi:hypothetical protein
MKEHSGAPARGEILKVIAGLPIIGAAVAAIGSIAEAADNKAQFKYQDKPGPGGAKCSQCRFFKAPHGCSIVTGTIRPDGWCIAWARRVGG